LASLLGWIQAYRRELAFLPEATPGRLSPLRGAITEFEIALADGSDVELQRLESLSALWSLTLPSDKQVKARAANALEKVLKRLLHSAGVGLAKDLPDPAQHELCLKARDLLSSELRSAQISDAVIEETKARAIQSLSIREAWLYRDFQAGIGDVMIQESPSKVRRFDVVGYRGFEAMVYEGSQEERRWLKRLTNTIEDLDISRADRFDARVELLRNTLRATAQLVQVLAAIEKRRNSIPTKTLAISTKVLANPVRAADN
jgi:hypothetical protein